MASKVDLIEECRRKNSVVVSRLKEEKSEGYLDTVETVQHLLKQMLTLDAVDENPIRLGGGGRGGLLKILF